MYAAWKPARVGGLELRPEQGNLCTVNVIVGHIAGVPVEEVLLPFISVGGVVMLSVRALLTRKRRRRR